VLGEVSSRGHNLQTAVEKGTTAKLTNHSSISSAAIQALVSNLQSSTKSVSFLQGRLRFFRRRLESSHFLFRVSFFSLVARVVPEESKTRRSEIHFFFRVASFFQTQLAACRLVSDFSSHFSSYFSAFLLFCSGSKIS